MPEIKQMSLGVFIAGLSDFAKDKPVYFDFACLAPTSFRSYRGDYGQLALGYSDEPSSTVAEILEGAQAALGRVFEGYKGGGYTMDERTPLWAANWGRCSDQQIVALRETPAEVWIITKQEDLE